MLSLFKEQPRAFYMIFMLELWERFGFYTAQGILTLYFIRFLGFTDVQAYYTFGAFSALVFGMVALGGYLGDKVLGTKRTIVLGLIILSLGYFTLAFADKGQVFLALGLVCVGNGLFKANPSNLLAKCYEENDHRLHGGFTLYYMAINLGSMLALFIGPTVASLYGYPYAYFLAALGLLLGLVNYAYQRHHVRHIKTEADQRSISVLQWGAIMLLITALTLASSYLLQHVMLAKKLLWMVITAVTLMYVYYMRKESKVSALKMLVAFILMIEAIVFFTLYQQMPTSLNLFAVNNVIPDFFGVKIDPQSFQALNPIWIVLMSPALAMMYSKLHKSHKDLSIAHKFALGMTLCGLSFFLLYFTRYFANDAGMVSSWWLVGSYFFQSLGELLVSALGVAMVAQLVPPSIVGFVMGMWFLTSSIAGFTGAYVASRTAIPQHLNPGFESLDIYSGVFAQIGLTTLGIALVMWLIAPWLNRFIEAEEDYFERRPDEKGRADHFKINNFRPQE